MPDCLLQHSLSCIHEDDGKVGCRSTGNHVPGILNMTGSIGDNEFSFRSGEITVGHINGYALLTLSAQTVSKQSQVNMLIASSFAGKFNGLHLIFEDGFAVVQ